MSKINPDDRRIRDTHHTTHAQVRAAQGPEVDAKNKVDSEVKGQVSSAELYGNLTASAERISGTQFAEFFRLTLIERFGEKTGEDAFNNVTSELKRGKTLSFGLIKSAVLGAASRNGDNMKDVQDSLNELDKGDPGSLGKGAGTASGMNSAINNLTARYDPARILAFLEQMRRLSYQFADNLKDTQFEEEARQQMLRRAELKEDDKKRNI